MSRVEGTEGNSPSVYLLPLQVQEADESGQTIARLWGDVRPRWLLLLLCTVVFGALALTFSFSISPTYRAEVLMAVAEDESSRAGLGGVVSQFGGLAGLAGVQLGRGNNRNEAVATLTSRALTEEFIRDNDLIRVLFANRWDADRQTWKTGLLRREPTLADALHYFDRRVRSVHEDRRTGLITLSIEWRNRQLAADWANELVHRLNSKLQTRAIAESRASLEYLEGELRKTDLVALREAAFTLTEQELKRIMAASIRDEYAMRVIDPAIAPDERDYTRPRRVRITLAAAAFGLFVGVIIALRLAYRRRKLAVTAASGS